MKTDPEQLPEEWAVLELGTWENDNGPLEWYAFCNEEAIAAYFAEEKDAFRFRLDKINQIPNT